MTEMEAGAVVVVRDAVGAWLPRRTTTGVVEGRDFEVVWLCTEEEWQAARAENRDPDARPWPAEDVSCKAAASADA